MPVTVIVGAQWGDEGKGKLTDALAAESALVIRAQGGNNAGHTVVVGDETYKLHLLPSGILRQETPCLITDGVAINPQVLLGEIEALQERDLPCDNLTISPRCHLILPYHIALDEGQESSQLTRIGTTKRGNGPVFADKMSRLGIRIAHLAEPDALRAALEENLTLKNPVLRGVFGHPGFEVGPLMDELLALWPDLEPFVGDPLPVVHAALEADAPILVEGAQGVLLDINFDMYPYVTSSHPGASGATLGTGIPVNRITEIIGVVKAYTTRVGVGPFPTEQSGDIADALRERGGEYGTTTGRPRRIGWLDLPLLRHACDTNGFTSLCVTKVDVLDDLETIPVCSSYLKGHDRLTEFPHTLRGWELVEPVYQQLAGWRTDTSRAAINADLPPALQTYLGRIEGATGVPVNYVSCGASREALVKRR